MKTNKLIKSVNELSLSRCMKCKYFDKEKFDCIYDKGACIFIDEEEKESTNFEPNPPPRLNIELFM